MGWIARSLGVWRRLEDADGQHVARSRRCLSILRRTTDLLRQISLVPYVSDGVAQRAIEALRMMDRYPVADNAVMGAAATGSVEADDDTLASAALSGAAT